MVAEGKVHGRGFFALYALGMAHAKAGHIEEARGMLAELMEPDIRPRPRYR